MRNSKFKPSEFFNLDAFQWKNIFEGVEIVWEIIPKIEKFTKGKLIKGKNCKIAKSAFIRGGVILGDNVIVGHAVELKNCIIMNNTNIAHLNYIGDSIVGEYVNIGGGAMLANFRLDAKPVHIKHKENKISTNLEKFGAVIGDNTKIGVNAVLNPGTILGKNCQVYPLTSVIGYHPDDSTIK